MIVSLYRSMYAKVARNERLAMFFFLPPTVGLLLLLLWCITSLLYVSPYLCLCAVQSEGGSIDVYVAMLQIDGLARNDKNTRFVFHGTCSKSTVVFVVAVCVGC